MASAQPHSFPSRRFKSENDLFTVACTRHGPSTNKRSPDLTALHSSLTTHALILYGVCSALLVRECVCLVHVCCMCASECVCVCVCALCVCVRLSRVFLERVYMRRFWCVSQCVVSGTNTSKHRQQCRACRPTVVEGLSFNLCRLCISGLPQLTQ